MSEAAVFSKCAWRLIPFMGLLYVANFLDRVNVGFAALSMNADIGLTASYKGFALDLRYSGTDLGKGACGFYMGTNHACAGDVIATLTYNITLLP